MLGFRSEIKGLKRLVVKVGSNVLTDSGGNILPAAISNLCNDLARIISEGIEVVLVTSGAINAGRKYLKSQNCSSIDFQQAASAVGQPVLMSYYNKALSDFHITPAQILLTHEDFNEHQRFLNVRNTLERLLEEKILPVLNENDSVSFAEITVGDNDHLAAMSALIISADLLLLISSTDGLYDRDPADPAAIHFPQIEYNFAQQIDLSSKTSSGRGGMASKLKAVKKAGAAGVPAIIAASIGETPVIRALTEKVGTYFAPLPQKNSAHKSWLIARARNQGKLEVDQGCYQAILNNASLLPAGVKKVCGDFDRGECLTLVFKGQEFAVGLSEYSSREIDGIKGLKSADIESVLGYNIGDEVIHKNNLAKL